MGSVINEIECPNCKSSAYNDFYYKTGEEFTHCSDCGYSYEATYKRDENNILVTKDGTENFNFDNLILEISESLTPFGSYRLKYLNEIGTMIGSLTTEQQWIAFKEDVTTRRDYKNVELFTLSRFMNNEIVVETLKSQPLSDASKEIEN